MGLKQSRVVPRDRKKKKSPLPNSNISLPHHLPLTPSTLLHSKFSSIFDLLSAVFIFFVIDLMVSIDFVLRTCAQSTVGVQEGINSFYINSYGENNFGLRRFLFTNDLQE